MPLVSSAIHRPDRTDPEARARLLDAFAEAARLEDRGADICGSTRSALAEGLGEARTPRELARNLVMVAEANLPLARLLEGHVNALDLVSRLDGRTDPERLHGVWGADGPEPLREVGGCLRGGKRYASGLGIVERAVVTVGTGPDARLALVETRDTRRFRPEAWAMLGMRATVSGEIDLTDAPFTWLGAPGDYYREPHFVGGVWRIAACQLGGAFGLLGAARDWLLERDRLGADAQIARLGPLVGRALAAFGLVEEAGEIAEGLEGRANPERAVMLSIQARLLTEDLAQDAIAATERSVGLAHFAEGAETGRIARDLATYCRQAARDAFEQRAGRHALTHPGRISTLWTGQ